MSRLRCVGMHERRWLELAPRFAVVVADCTPDVSFLRAGEQRDLVAVQPDRPAFVHAMRGLVLPAARAFVGQPRPRFALVFRAQQIKLRFQRRLLALLRPVAAVRGNQPRATRRLGGVDAEHPLKIGIVHGPDALRLAPRPAIVVGEAEADAGVFVAVEVARRREREENNDALAAKRMLRHQRHPGVLVEPVGRLHGWLPRFATIARAVEEDVVHLQFNRAVAVMIIAGNEREQQVARRREERTRAIRVSVGIPQLDRSGDAGRRLKRCRPPP